MNKELSIVSFVADYCVAFGHCVLWNTSMPHARMYWKSSKIPQREVVILVMDDRLSS